MKDTCLAMKTTIFNFSKHPLHCSNTPDYCYIEPFSTPRFLHPPHFNTLPPPRFFRYSRVSWWIIWCISRGISLWIRHISLSLNQLLLKKNTKTSSLCHRFVFCFCESRTVSYSGSCAEQVVDFEQSMLVFVLPLKDK